MQLVSLAIFAIFSKMYVLSMFNMILSKNSVEISLETMIKNH